MCYLLIFAHFSFSLFPPILPLFAPFYSIYTKSSIFAVLPHFALSYPIPVPFYYFLPYFCNFIPFLSHFNPFCLILPCFVPSHSCLIYPLLPHFAPSLPNFAVFPHFALFLSPFLPFPFFPKFFSALPTSFPLPIPCILPHSCPIFLLFPHLCSILSHSIPSSPFPHFLSLFLPFSPIFPAGSPRCRTRGSQGVPPGVQRPRPSLGTPWGPPKGAGEGRGCRGCSHPEALSGTFRAFPVGDVSHP